MATTPTVGKSELELIEMEVTDVHKNIANCHARLAELVRRRDAIIIADDAAKKAAGEAFLSGKSASGTTIHVPTAKLAAPKGH